MGAHGDAAAHVNDDQVQLLIAKAVLLGVAASHRLLVQGVEDAAAGQFGHTGDTGNVSQLVHHHGVNDKGRNANLVPNLPGEDSAQIGGVLTLYAGFQIGKQSVGDGVGAAGDGLEQAAAADDHVEGLDVAVLLLEEVQDDVLAEVLLVDDGGVLGDLLGGMAKRLLEQKSLVLEHAHLGGGGTGIDNQALDRHSWYSSLMRSSWPRPPRQPERWN